MQSIKIGDQVICNDVDYIEAGILDNSTVYVVVEVDSNKDRYYVRLKDMGELIFPASSFMIKTVAKNPLVKIDHCLSILASKLVGAENHNNHEDREEILRKIDFQLDKRLAYTKHVRPIETK